MKVIMSTLNMIQSIIWKNDMGKQTNGVHVKPKECCELGTYGCQVPMSILGRRRDIDYCIADIVAALNAANIITVASCCGHGEESIASIVLEDGRELRVKNGIRFWENT